MQLKLQFSKISEDVKDIPIGNDIKNDADDDAKDIEQAIEDNAKYDTVIDDIEKTTLR